MPRAKISGVTEMHSNGGKAAYVSPKELMFRWQCSRSQVDRIARRAELTRLLLGCGRNGMVLYIRAEVEAMEQRARA